MPIGKFAPTQTKLAENFTCRQAQRFHTDYLIENDLCERRPITAEEIKELVFAINNDQRSDFGVVKLSKLDINQLIAVPAELLKHEWQRVYPQPITLVRYASLRKRYAIVMSLLRAGADMTITWTSNSDVLQGCRKMLHLFPKNFLCWILQYVTERKTAAFENYSVAQLDDRSSSQQNGDLTSSSSVPSSTSCRNPVYSCQCCQSHAAVSDGDFLLMDPCGCMVCEQCFWSKWLQRENQDGKTHWRLGELQCPCCG